MIIGYQTLEPTETSGYLTVSLRLGESLKKEVDLLLVDDARLVPGEVTMFNHPDSSATLNVTGGVSFGL